jgi:hypothetical protein
VEPFPWKTNARFPCVSWIAVGSRARARADILGGYFGIFRAFAAQIGYIIIDSDIGYFAILLQISGFSHILISGYSHFAANFRIFVGYLGQKHRIFSAMTKS